MRKRGFGELAVYELEQDDRFISFDRIRSLYIEKTSDIVYLTLNCKLFGVICLGDLLYRMHDGMVEIVTNFIRIYEFQDDAARDIFTKRNNIQKIPVVDPISGELLGDYSRWDDAKKSWVEWVKNQEVVWGRLKKYLKDKYYKKVYMVYPVIEKSWIMETVAEIFLARGTRLIFIEKEHLKNLIQESEKSLIILADRDEWRGVECMDGFDYEKINKNLNWFSFSKLYEELNLFDKYERLSRYSAVHEGDTAKNLLIDLKEQGVSVFSFYNDVYHVSDYFKKFVKGYLDNIKIYKLQKGEFWPAETEIGSIFFGELLKNKDYRSRAAQKDIKEGHSVHTTGKDYTSKYYNVINGRRRTCFQPRNCDGKIYLFGACMVMGAYQEDQYTIASQLQKRLCAEGFSYYVENYGTYENVFEVMQKIVFHSGDIVIIWTGENTYEGIESIDLRDICEVNQVPPEWCLDGLTHVNHKVTKLIADTFFDRINKYLQKEPSVVNKKNEIHFRIRDYNDILGTYVNNTFLKRNFDFSTDFAVKRGCIVTDLNAAPAVYGDKIEKACSMVEELIIFIPRNVINVRYSFEEYVAGLTEMIADNRKVKIISGDGFVPYKNFFQSYYSEEYISLDQAKTDAKIYAQCIAKPLNLIYRFDCISKEKEKSRQYSKVLKEELPVMGVQFVEL